MLLCLEFLKQIPMFQTCTISILSLGPENVGFPENLVYVLRDLGFEYEDTILDGL